MAHVRGDWPAALSMACAHRQAVIFDQQLISSGRLRMVRRALLAVGP